ncbi:hypothetical protein AB0D74_43850 [Streptomyces sp. NPDC048278]|uniref:hypothetical protein n=1 Tax=Streptomyces sp. NPDC048278 TaxID=3155809 RepID=UPI0034233F09
MSSPRGKIRVAIHASDPLYRAGLLDYVRKDHRLSEADADRVDENDIFVVVIDTSGNATLEMLRSWPNACAAKFLLIVKDEWTVDTSTATEYGVRGVLQYADCTRTAFSEALITIDGGGTEISEAA